MSFTELFLQFKIFTALTTDSIFQASSQLPKSSYFKLVDVWLLSSILIIFTIIVFHAIIDRLQDTPKPAIPKHPLSAIIIKPDIGGRPIKSKMKSPSKPSKQLPPVRSSSKGSHLSSVASRNSMEAFNSKSSPPCSPEHEAQELVTTFAHLGVENENATTSKPSTEEAARKRSNNKIGTHDGKDDQLSTGKNTVGKTYREQPKSKNRDSFVAMERADSDDEESDVDVGKAILQRGIEWKFWKWSFKDIDKCKTMIITSRVFVFSVVVIFNIFYWSVALRPQ